MRVILNLNGLVETHLLSGTKAVADEGIVLNSKGYDFMTLSLVMFISGQRADGGKRARNICVRSRKSIHC